MPEHKGISCELHVEDQKVNEYQVEQHGSVCSAYIISQEDKLFGFHLNVNCITLGGTARLDLELWADGQKLDGFTFTETSYLVDDAQIQDTTGAVKVVKLKFAKLETVDEKKGNPETRQDILQKLGTLEVKLWRAHHDATQTASLAYQPQPSKNPIYEKSIKGDSITHCTELANAKVIKTPSACGYLTRKIDPYESPWVTFLFRHASKSLLQAAEIIPKEKAKQILFEKNTQKDTKVKPAKDDATVKAQDPAQPQVELRQDDPALPVIKVSRSARGYKTKFQRDITDETLADDSYRRKRSRLEKHWPSDS
ncbi:hypothetical protein TWF281_004376 [Arthrobotrys megalospora]